MLNPASVFADSDVVEHYRCRPPYPRAVYEHLLKLAPRHEAILDLGCGPGKLVRELADAFSTAVAVDASEAMLDQARTLPRVVVGSSGCWAERRRSSIRRLVSIS